MMHAQTQESLLSVCLITYNHARFIGEAIESVLMQKVDFLWELIIADDFSTDGTREILIEYKQRYPELVRLILQEKNVGAAQNWMDLFTTPKSKYIAYLEGDDFWTDPLKLQKQVDFLERHSHYSMCCTNFSVIDSDGQTLSREGWWGAKKLNISHLEILQSTPPKFLTTVIRRSALPIVYPAGFLKAVNGDGFLFALVSRNGDAAFMDIITASYRRHSHGVWSSRNQISQAEAELATYTLMKAYFFEPDEKKAINIRIYNILQRLLVLYLIESNTLRVRQIREQLRTYNFVLFFFALGYALSQKSIYQLKKSSVGQVAKSILGSHN